MFENEIMVDSLWLEVCHELKAKLGESRFATWIEVLKPICYEDHKLMVLCQSNYIKTFINGHFKDYIEEAINNQLFPLIQEKTELLPVVATDEIYLEAIKNSGGQTSFFSKSGEKATKKGKLKKISSSSNSLDFTERFTFDNFIKGKNNEFAMAAAEAVAKNPAGTYNPLFIYGNSGLGKTHLMKAIGYEIHKNFDCKVLYLSSEKFTIDLIDSIRDKSQNSESEFRKKYRNVDVLLIDDIQFIAGKTATQEEFFHTFNELYSRNKQIIISSDRPPKEIKNLEDRLKSRFNMGLTVDIQPPDFETRMAILQDKVKFEPITLSNEVLEFIAMNIKNNIRELEGALINVLAHYKLKQDAPMTVDYVKGILAQKLNELNRRELDIDLIKETVSKYFKIEVSDLSSKNRANSIAYPRQVAMYLCRNMLDCALGNIGSAFEKDHTTIMHGVKKIDEKIRTTESVKQDIENIKKMLED